MPLRPKIERILYKDTGTLEGHVNGQFLKVRHPKFGASGFQVFWDGQWYLWLRADLIEDELGIEVYAKKNGEQKGYPSEPVTRAVWRHLVNRYNNCDPDVKYA